MTNGVNTRELALEMLMEINEKGQYSHLVLNDVLEKYQYLTKQERAFLTRLTEGTIERQISIDYVIDLFSKTKVNKMKPLIRNLLRMSVYQLLFMDAIPDSAVCNEAVKLAKRRGFSALSGFVNGVLRTVARNREEITYPTLSLQYAIPEWMITLWEEAYGEEKTLEILSGFSGNSAMSIRVNPNHITPEKLKESLEAEGVTVEPVVGMDNAFYISKMDSIRGLTSFQNGDFYVQDVSSMKVALLSGVKKGDYVIDVCAAPGGKSIHLAELLENTGMVEARDLTEYKVGLMEENRIRQGLSNMKTVVMDATVFDKASVHRADVLICDLPCSGLGVLSKKTDIRHKMTLEKTRELVQLQREILDTVYDYVKPGGTLVYSTCTIHSAENEGNVAWFLEKYPFFTLEYEEQLFPGKENRDGFFIAKLKRNL